jgi:hypothetical protein
VDCIWTKSTADIVAFNFKYIRTGIAQINKFLDENILNLIITINF